MSTKTDEPTVALEHSSLYELKVTDPKVLKIASKLRLKPATVITKIEKALPAVVEQHMYLERGAEYRILPNSLKIILRTFLGERELKYQDLADENSIFDSVEEYLDEVLTLQEKTSLQYDGVNLSMETASKLVLAYGSNTDQIIDSIEANIEELGIRLGMRYRSPEIIMGYAISFLVDDVLEYNQKHGLPNVTDIMDHFNDDTRLCEYVTRINVGYDGEHEDPELYDRVKELCR